MKKILSLVLAVAMIAVMSVSVFAADPSFVETYSFDFSDTNGLKGFTASYVADNKYNAVASDVVDGAIVDGAFVMGSMGFMVAEPIKAADGIKVTFDAVLDFDKITGNPWFQGILTFVNTDGHADELLALTGEEKEQSFDAYYLNFAGNGKNFQAHTSVLNDSTLGNDTVWGGDPAELVSGQKYAVEYIILPTENGADVTIKVDGEVVDMPNNPEFANLLTDELVLMIGATHFGDYPASITVDNVKVYTMQEEAAQTGFATVALAVVAMVSGAYVVSKKH